jgi:uncharacterized membrane protein YagU involved in acid resistance
MSSSIQSGVQVVLLAAMASGLLDLIAATTLSASRGVPPKRMLQTIASAQMGPKAFETGTHGAALGLVFHFFIALTASGMYYVATRYLTIIGNHQIISGLAYGILIHLVMTFIVLPMSTLRRPFSTVFFLLQLVIHMFFVGLPIALVVKHFSPLPV